MSTPRRKSKSSSEQRLRARAQTAMKRGAAKRVLERQAQRRAGSSLDAAAKATEERRATLLQRTIVKRQIRELEKALALLQHSTTEVEAEAKAERQAVQQRAKAARSRREVVDRAATLRRKRRTAR